MKKRHTILWFIIIALNACSLGDYMVPGKVEIQRHELIAFDTLRIDGMVEVQLVSDTTYFADIICPKNLHHHVELRQHNGNLHIGQHIGARFVGGYDLVRIELHTPSLRDLWAYSPCLIGTADTFATPSMGLVCRAAVVEANLCIKANYLHIISSWGEDAHAQICLSGQVRHLEAEIFGTCHLNSEAMQTNHTDLRHESLANIHIGSAQTLHIDNQKGIGHTYYLGQPTISIVGDAARVSPKP